MKEEEKEILLVKLPEIKGITQDFFAIGYDISIGFSFALITKNMMESAPMRFLPYPEYQSIMIHNTNDMKILGKIKPLPNNPAESHEKI